MEKETKLISLPEASRQTGIGESTLRHAAINGSLQATKIGLRAWAVTLEAVNDWKRSRRKPGRPPKSR